MQTLLDKIIRRMLGLLTRLGHLIEEGGITYLARSESLDPDDVRRCECGGKLKLIAVIAQPEVIEKILQHIGLDP